MITDACHTMESVSGGWGGLQLAQVYLCTHRHFKLERFHSVALLRVQYLTLTLYRFPPGAKVKPCGLTTALVVSLRL